MATLNALTITITLLLYFVAFSSARLSLPVNNVHIPSKKTIPYHLLFLDTEPELLGIERQPKSIHRLPNPTTFALKESKNGEPISFDPTIFEPAKLRKDELTNNDHKSLEPTNFDPTNDEQHNPTTTVEVETEITNNKHDHLSSQEHHETDKDLSENTVSIETLHLNPSKYVIRPINRHFRIRRCHHHMKQDHQNQQQMPYEKDMITGEDDMILARQTFEPFDPSVLHISTHSAPAKRPRIHHYYHHHDEDGNMMKRPSRQYTKKQTEEERDAFRQWLVNQKLKKQVEEEIQKGKERDARKGGFMKSFRKFLNHF